MKPRQIHAVLVDLSGTLHIENSATDGAVQALRRLQERSDVALKFVTNTTKESASLLLDRLHHCGFTSIERHQIFTSLSAARRYIEREGLRPMLMLEPEAMEDFKDLNCDEPQNAVVVGLAPSMFNFQQMNRAFKLLLHEDCKLVAIHKGRYYKRSDGLALGPGPFIQAFEFATGKVPHVVGKPSSNFYNEAINLLQQETDQAFENVWMIGDDVQDDVLGAIDSGFNAILVKTGKYREGDEEQIPKEKQNVFKNFSDAVSFLLQKFDGN
ncbi:hypothetical protein M3Y97_00130000 [Aphelenchoides bicaudatus]|nr:hypothetical protein M3Y97_00130000 [Aphelenchoides bicaudatus]